MNKIDFVRTGVYTSENQLDEYMKTNERRDVLGGSIGSIIHKLLLNYSKKLVALIMTRINFYKIENSISCLPSPQYFLYAFEFGWRTLAKWYIHRCVRLTKRRCKFCSILVYSKLKVFDLSLYPTHIEN